MVSDEEDNTATVYGDEFFTEADDVSEEEDDKSLQFQQIDEDEDVDLIDDEEDEEEELEEDSTSSAAGEATIAVATTEIPTVTTTTTETPPQTTTTTVAAPISQSDVILVKKPLPLDDSRRLFQRLWTDEDEIELLQGFLDYTTQRGTNGSSHHHHDTAAFYDQIKGKLQLDFNKNQLVEKLRRLKKKYRNVLSKISSGKEYVFKSPHDQASFDISCKIWSETVAAVNAVDGGGGIGGGIDGDEVQNPNLNPNFNVAFNLNDNNGNESEMKVPRSRKRSRFSGVKIEENYEQQKPTNPNLVEETVKSCLLPLFKELVNNSSNVACGSSKGVTGLMNMNSFGGVMNFAIGDMSDEKWRKQHILELEVYSKRLELMQDQIKVKLDELKSIGS